MLPHPRQCPATLVSDLLKSPYLHILTQYGCGTTGQLVKQVFIGNGNLNLTDGDLHTILQNAINTNILPEPTNRSNVYMLFLDDNTGIKGSITMCEPKSDNAFGYHNFFTTAKGIPAIIPSSRASATPASRTAAQKTTAAPSTSPRPRNSGRPRLPRTSSPK